MKKFSQLTIVSGTGSTFVSSGEGPSVDGPLSGDAWAAVPQTSYDIVDLSRTKVTNFSQQKAVCYAGTSDINCSNAVRMTASKTISVSQGASRGWAAGQLGWTNTYSTEVSTTCSKTLKKGQSLVAYPYGTKATYKIRKVVSPRGSSSTSGWMTSFAPTGISCYVR